MNGAANLKNFATCWKPKEHKPNLRTQGAAMPTKRRVAKGREHRITRAALEAFTAQDMLGLHRALGLRPWQPSPLDADTPEPPAWAGTLWADGWGLAHDLRGKLEAMTPSR